MIPGQDFLIWQRNLARTGHLKFYKKQCRKAFLTFSSSLIMRNPVGDCVIRLQLIVDKFIKCITVHVA